MLRRELAAYQPWLRTLYAGPGRDPEGELWRALALNQEDRSLLSHWYGLCEEAGHSLPDHYVDIGLLGLQHLPEAPATEEAPTSEHLAFVGLFRWAAGLSQGAANRKRFQRRLGTLLVLYPRAPSTHRERIVPLLKAFPDAPFRDWLEGAGLRVAPVQGTSAKSGKWLRAEPPSRQRLEALLRRLRKEPARRLVSEIRALVRDHELAAEATGETEYLVKTALNFSGRLRRAAPWEALRLARLALDWAPSDPYAWTQLASALKSLDRHEEVEAVLWEGMRRFPENEVVRTALADLLAKTNRSGDAETILRETMDRFPDNAFARVTLGDLLAKSGRSEEAETLLREAMRRFPDDEVPRNALADLLAQTGRIGEAETILRGTMQRFPRDEVAANALAKLLAERGCSEDAETLLRETMRRFPRDRVAPHSLVYWLLRWERVTDAEELYWEIRARFPEDAYTRNLAERLSRVKEGWDGEIGAPGDPVEELTTWEIPWADDDLGFGKPDIPDRQAAAPVEPEFDEAAEEEKFQRPVEEDPALDGNGDSTSRAASDDMNEEGSGTWILDQRVLRHSIVGLADLRLRTGENGSVREQALGALRDVLTQDREQVYPRLVLCLHEPNSREAVVEEAEAFRHSYPLRFLAVRKGDDASGGWNTLLRDFAEHRAITLLGRVAAANGAGDPDDARRLAVWLSEGNGSRKGFQAFTATRLEDWLGEGAADTEPAVLHRRLLAQRSAIEQFLGDALRRAADQGEIFRLEAGSR